MLIDHERKYFLIYSQIVPIHLRILIAQTLFDTFLHVQFPILLNSLQCDYFYQGFYLRKYSLFVSYQFCSSKKVCISGDEFYQIIYQAFESLQKQTLSPDLKVKVT